MLRNHCGWAKRLFGVVSLVVLCTCSAVRGAPLTGITASGYQAPTSYSISGYVFVDAAQRGVMYPGEWGLSGVTIYLTEYSASNPSSVVGTFSTSTTANGYYDFTGLTTGNLYTLTEVQPTNYYSTGNSVGGFRSATGGTLTAPSGIGGVPANGQQDPTNPYAISSIFLPAPSGAFAPSGGYVYSAVNYNFGQFPQNLISSDASSSNSNKPSIAATVPAGSAASAPLAELMSSLAVVGSNNRFLAGPGAGSLALSAIVQNSAASGSSAIDWQVSSLSTGLSIASTAGTSLMPLNKTTFAASIDGTNLNPGTQNATMVVAGQVTGVGSVVPSSTSSVVIDPIQPRSLQPVSGGGTANAIAVPTTGGGLLYGSVVSLPTAYSVTSTNANPDSDHTSVVNVSAQTANAVSTADGKTQVGKVTAAQTQFSSGGAQAVALSVEADHYGPTSASASLNVTTAEADSVHDNTAYAPISVFYNISNVGYAATGGVDPKQGFGAPLSGQFVAGSRLSSRVAATRASGSSSTATGYDGTTLSRQSVVNASNILGTVGSECDVVASPTMSGSALVTMAWRGRNDDENGSAFVNGNLSSTNWANVLPNGVPALASDVVEVGGVPSGLAYAVQVSYDDRINTYLNGSGGSATAQDGYLVKLVKDSSGNSKWENAVLDNSSTGSNAVEGWSGPLQNVYDSKGNLVAEGFLETEYAKGYTLDQLVGSWGVDTANQQSWAVVNNGGGDFAVVPEPSTFALLGAAAAGLLVYRLRRCRAAQAISTR